MGQGDEGAHAKRGPNLGLAIAYLCMVIALAAFGAGRLREFVPRFAAYISAVRQTQQVYAVTQAAFAQAIAQDAATPKPNPVLPHAIPFYPVLAQRRHEEGDVLLKLLVLPNGEVGDAAVLRSSGHPQLDAAALTGVGGWYYVPAVRAHRAVQAWVLVRVRFRTAPAANRPAGG